MAEIKFIPESKEEIKGRTLVEAAKRKARSPGVDLGSYALSREEIKQAEIESYIQGRGRASYETTKPEGMFEPWTQAPHQDDHAPLGGIVEDCNHG